MRKRKKKKRDPWTHALRALVRDPAGIHGRPAALLAARLRANGAEVSLGLRRVWGPAAGRVVELGSGERLKIGALMAAHVRGGEEVEFVASGPDAAMALEVVREVLEAEDLEVVAVAEELVELLGIEDVKELYERALREARKGMLPGRGGR